ncbi:MAG: hypothetical protein ABGZ37_02760 [Akkermansiaceae bacterium]
MATFGTHLQRCGKALNDQNPGRYSLRKVASHGWDQSLVSQSDREWETGTPGEKTTLRLAEILGEDPDVLLVLGGKGSPELQTIIGKRPKLFADLLRSLKNEPDHAILHFCPQSAGRHLVIKLRNSHEHSYFHRCPPEPDEARPQVIVKYLQD